ncbi:hypothetical protein [Azospirillum sp. ST 5-10]|uniref:hypothetical protein n=1 Tax=unclassified Azospirillum TaxID=2630922 RepID=UPI003F4A09B1
MSIRPPCPRRSAVGLAAALATAALLAAPAAAQSGPDLQAYSAARFVPFAKDAGGGLPLADAPRLAFRIPAPAGAPAPDTPRRDLFTMTMDTGSTGVVVSAADLPGYTADEAAGSPQGWEFLSSSKRLWIGHWLTRELVFLNGRGDPLATATVPVLAVETEHICPGWSETANLPTCDQPTRTSRMPTGIAYLGVGFGREHDGQPQGTPDKNPLLNLTAVGDRAVTPGSLRAGYIVTRDGVHIGLTPANAKGFAFAKLRDRSLNAAGQPASADPRDWAQATMAVSVDGGAPQEGPVLIDTGIPQMYLTVADPGGLRTVAIETASETGKRVSGLAPDSRVEVRFPGAGRPIATYGFTVGSGDPLAPSAVIVNRPGTPAFVNTGRHVIRGFDVLFDADGGWFGLRPAAANGG